MLLVIILLIFGLAMLVLGADQFTEGSAKIARYIGVSELVIGLTLVSIGTSLPELGASGMASFFGSGEMAIGNVVGSNVANVALVLAVCMVLAGYKVDRKILKRDGLFMMGISILFVVFVAVGYNITRWEGIVLLAFFFFYMRLLFKTRRVGFKEESEIKLSYQILRTIGGIAGVGIGAYLVVDSGIKIAEFFGVMESVIGSTIIAFGTSVPELSVSLNALLKGHKGISIGNIIGSNIFNLLWVVGIASFIGTLTCDSLLFNFNIPIMLLISGLLLVFMRTRWRLERREGIIFLGIYLCFLFLNYKFGVFSPG